MKRSLHHCWRKVKVKNRTHGNQTIWIFVKYSVIPSNTRVWMGSVWLFLQSISNIKQPQLFLWWSSPWKRVLLLTAVWARTQEWSMLIKWEGFSTTAFSFLPAELWFLSHHHNQELWSWLIARQICPAWSGCLGSLPGRYLKCLVFSQGNGTIKMRASTEIFAFNPLVSAADDEGRPVVLGLVRGSQQSSHANPPHHVPTKRPRKTY